MNEELPKVYANPIDHELNNNTDIFYSSKKDTRGTKNNIPRLVNEIFANPHHVYKSKVLITINNQSSEEIIVGKTNNQLLTLDGHHININDIEDIQRL